MAFVLDNALAEQVGKRANGLPGGKQSAPPMDTCNDGGITTITINKEHQSIIEILVEGTRAMQMAKLFQGRDIPFEVIVSDASAYDMILYSGTPFKIFLSFHACSEAISFPWCHTADPCPDYVNLLEGGTAMAKAIFETAGRMYKVGNFKDIMYYASGTSIDWSYGTARIPFSYLVELRSKQDRFTLRREEIIVCCKEILNGVKALVEFADKKKCLNCSVIPKKLRN
ncbi:unnamed protein product [Spodoptera exigua]|nr:unnamed protein product [Spodoptera exigua]